MVKSENIFFHKIVLSSAMYYWKLLHDTISLIWIEFLGLPMVQIDLVLFAKKFLSFSTYSKTFQNTYFIWKSEKLLQLFFHLTVFSIMRTQTQEMIFTHFPLLRISIINLTLPFILSNNFSRYGTPCRCKGKMKNTFFLNLARCKFKT